MSRLRRLSVLLSGVTVILCLAACGGGASGGAALGDASPSAARTPYTNARYGFTLTYPQALSVVTLTPAAGAEYAIAFADKDGAQIGNEYANGLLVSVFAMARAVTPAEVRGLEEQVSAAIEKENATLSGVTILEGVRPVEVNGALGYVVDFSFTQAGEQLICRRYMLIKGAYEYDLVLQALAADWDSLQGTLEETAQTFTLD